MSATTSTLDLIRTPTGRKFVRYCSLSAFNVVFGQALLLFFHSVVGMPGWAANLTAIVLGTGPAYIISRRWVWEKTGKHSLSGEVLPFWALNGLGTVLSTLFVGVADVIWQSAIAVSAASISAWFIVWVLKYFTMDRVVFRTREPVTV
jgi:putative flippase GtrA